MPRCAPLFGVETEYAVTGLRHGAPLEREAVIHGMMHAARQQLVHLPDFCSGGTFLENGSRFYIDCGQHPEMSSPECTDPCSVVRYVHAGHRIISQLAAAAAAQHGPGTEVICSLCNVDYSDTQATWGSHESYRHCMSPAILQPQLVPHLVSRIIYTGAGGFQPLSAGLEFSLSPRIAHFQCIESSDSTCRRGIYHTKNEPLSRDGSHRLHIICGESLCSQTALFLKVGTTALIVAMGEAGVNPGGDVQLESPLQALRMFAADPSCKKPAHMKNWRRMTAIEIQRHYLRQAEDHLHYSFMPSWATDVCLLWREVLDRLAEDPPSTNRMLDWSLKYSLYADQAAKMGIPWARLTFWNEIANRLAIALRNAGVSEPLLRLEAIVGPNSPVREEADRLTSFLRSKEMRWDDLRRILGMRARFFEIDTRFSELGQKGIFNALDAAGALQHRLDAVGDIEIATATPPAMGRAHIRGEAIRRLSAERGDWRCDWQNITNFADGRVLDLSDPFVAEEVWRDSSVLELGADTSRTRVLAYIERMRRGLS